MRVAASPVELGDLPDRGVGIAKTPGAEVTGTAPRGVTAVRFAGVALLSVAVVGVPRLHRVTGGTAECTGLIKDEVGRDEILPCPAGSAFVGGLLLVCLLIDEVWITLAELVVGDVGIDPGIEDCFHRCFGVKPTVGGDDRFIEQILLWIQCLSCLGNRFDYRLYMLCLMSRMHGRAMSAANDQPVAHRLGIDHDLVLLIDRSDAVVALNDAVAGHFSALNALSAEKLLAHASRGRDHLGALVVGDIALHRLAACPDAIIVFGEPAGYPVRLGRERLYSFLLLRPCGRTLTARILLAMATHEVLDRAFDLVGFLDQLGPVRSCTTLSHSSRKSCIRQLRTSSCR